MNTDDQWVLADFYMGLESQGNLVWNTNTSLCEALEIGCIDGRVVSIIIQGSLIVGTLSPNLSALSQLTYL